MDNEFINKMREAKKLEAEALLMILPERARAHVKVIEKELRTMVFECITESAMGKNEGHKDNEVPNSVHKVKID